MAVDDFEAFVRDAEPRLRQALIGVRGPVDGRDATAEALAYAWENWERVQAMSNPVGYLFRVGQSRSRLRKVPRVAAPTPAYQPAVEPELVQALGELTDQQRAAVFLVHGCGWGHGAVAEVLEVTASTVATHLQRGTARLRQLLEVSVDD